MVTMSPADGSTHPYHSGCVSNPGSHELISAANSRYSPTKTTKCDQILLPALPVADLQVKCVCVCVCMCICVCSVCAPMRAYAYIHKYYV